ncbi:class Ib ribonucleoside-diphosphate reductase assembly flavoprotein NrdI [Mycoplasma marinum]|uniref:Protein NrdI n=1 Tax=Mycoplasma marinum TaxID=1937190 RepID=A0A4R0XU27_9MOLU|nr:class Ib ribonucleoside-diphosphate reductase assembly flavoprotein NrdI [Mycoplasma marinum]TCG11297.1 class Ib ribonucleoside-diphosphate reductase assembly flavoprotein NrdI [Mycoplasma marinum]
MEKEFLKIMENIQRPSGEIKVVYFSSKSNNTHRMIQKLGLSSERIPININEKIDVNQDYVLFCPTYSGGLDITEGAVPKQVIQFLNKESNRINCKGIVASGNTNFGSTFALAGPILSQKLNVPYLYSFELLGTKQDVIRLKEILTKFWRKGDKNVK